MSSKTDSVQIGDNITVKNYAKHKTDTSMEKDEISKALTLHSLLWIPEGKKIMLQGSQTSGDQTSNNGNLYLVVRMFWCEEMTKSSVCWGTSSPHFGLRQVGPALLTPTFLDRTRNNFIVVEVWNKVSALPNDQLLGMVKLPLHQFYLSFRDNKVASALLKSKYPVLAVDDWFPVINPFTGSQHGHLKVLLAMGSQDQINSFQNMRMGGAPEEHRLLHSQAESTPKDSSKETKKLKPNQVEHMFELVVEGVRGLSMFENVLLGKQIVLYSIIFPSSHNRSLMIPKSHRTPTTLCVPDPAFHDVARHHITLPQGSPVQRYLLAAFSGSWVGGPSVSRTGGVPFELWRRFYYPNVRDQLVAKASLPLAKLCAMVTMMKGNESSVQTFSIPLVAVPTDEPAMSGQQSRAQDTGLLDVSVSYRMNKFSPAENERSSQDNQVSISLEIKRACGLKAAAEMAAEYSTSMAYPADVGVNSFIKVHIPLLPKKIQRTTRTVARSFAPDFSYQGDFTIPALLTRSLPYDGDDEDEDEEDLSLAEQLETAQAKFEIWHQVARTTASDSSSSHKTKDVLLGVVRVPLDKLLFCHSGIKGWFPIHAHSTWTQSPQRRENNHKGSKSDSRIVGGLELAVKFTELDDREYVIHKARKAGWAPPQGADVPIWESKKIKQGQSMEVKFNVERAWIPRLHAEHSGKVDKHSACYIRYKFYDKGAVCSKLSSLSSVDHEERRLLCELKHSAKISAAFTPPLAWYLCEEQFEVQLWLSSSKQQHTKSKARSKDKLLGSAYVDLFPLVDRYHFNTNISGRYPLFRAGAHHLGGACLHIQVCLGTGSSKNKQDGEFYDVGVEADESLVEEDSNGNITSLSEESPDNAVTQRTVQEEIIEIEGTIQVHVLVESAMHLSADGVDENTSPSTYVSYQTSGSKNPVCTEIVPNCTNPCWQHQRMERVKVATLQYQNLVFKVWLHQDHKDTETVPMLSSKEHEMNGVPGRDRVLGFASVDLGPLSSGMRQIVGWYNVMDFSGQCRGQIKVGIIPAEEISASRCASSSRPVLPQSFTMQEPLESPLTLHSSQPSLTRPDHSLDNLQSFTSQIEQGLAAIRRLKSTDVSLSEQGVQYATSLQDSSCSQSILFDQLRQNMKDLDDVQRRLKEKLAEAETIPSYPSASSHTSQITGEPNRDLNQITSNVQETSTLAKTPSDVTYILESVGPNSYNRANYATFETVIGGTTPECSVSGVALSEFTSSYNTNSRSELVCETNTGTNQSNNSSNKNTALLLQNENSDTGSDKSLHVNTGCIDAAVTDVVADMFEVNANRLGASEHSNDIETFSSADLPLAHRTTEVERQSIDEDSLLSSNEFSLYVKENMQRDLPKQYFEEKDSWLSSDDEVLSNPDSTMPGDNPDQDLREVIDYVSGLNPARDENDTGLNLDEGTENEENIDRSAQHGDPKHSVTDRSTQHSDPNYLDSERSEQREDPIGLDSDRSEQHKDLGSNKPPQYGNQKAMGSGNSSEQGEHVDVYSNPEEDEFMSEDEGIQEVDMSHEFDRDQRNTSGTTEESHGYSGRLNLPVNHNTAIPNFFMPPEQLEQSMRVLQSSAAYGASSEQSNGLLLREEMLGMRRPIAAEFSKRSQIIDAKKKGQVPIPTHEADRIARIFSAKF